MYPKIYIKASLAEKYWYKKPYASFSKKIQWKFIPLNKLQIINTFFTTTRL